jgi:polar amino acid transport system substrate-binding protein
MMKLTLAVAALLLASLACGGTTDEVAMGTEGAYPPYAFMNDDGELDGFERELGDELCQRAELECTWVINEWETIIPNLEAGDYDTIMAAMSITDERDEVIDFTQPYLPASPSVYIALVGAGDEAVNGRVAAQTATIHSDYLAGSGASMLEYELADEVVAAVLNGEADSALVDEEFGHSRIAGSDGKLALVGPEVPLDKGIGVGIREDDGELKAKFNDAIDSMKADGSLNDLIEEWFHEDARKF